MATLSVEKFLELVRLSNLVEGDLTQRTWQAALESATPEQALSADFAGAKLVEAGVLTRWQCDMLLKGKHKGFFLSKYKLLGHLGTGGMSSVFLAEHIAMHRRVGIKVLPASRVDDSSYLARFYLEARAAASLDHPNIVRVYDIDHEGQNHFLVMEYVEGRDLQHTVKDDGPLPYDLAANYVLQAASGLQHAHDRGLVHRDIKPANLLVDNRGTVKVLDMGLAKFDNDKASLTIAHDENVLGTADYLAPEQALNSHTVDSRADIYSLGCTLYFLLTGHPPFPDGTLTQRLMMHQTKSAPSIYNDRPNAPAALVNLCVKMMGKTPADRPTKAADVVKELEAFLSVAATRGEGGGESGSRFQPSRGGGSGDGSTVRRAKRSPGLEDTVHDRHRDTTDTMKGPPKAVPLPSDSGKSASRGPLKVAKPIEEDNPLAFIMEERSSRGRQEVPESNSKSGSKNPAASKQSGVKHGVVKPVVVKPVVVKPVVVNPGSGKQAGASSDVLKAKELGAEQVSPSESTDPLASLDAAGDFSFTRSGASLRRGESRRGVADSSDAATSLQPTEANLRGARKTPRRKSSQLPQWLWIVVGVGLVVSLIIVGICIKVMSAPPPQPVPPAAKAAANAKGQPGSKDGAKGKAGETAKVSEPAPIEEPAKEDAPAPAK